MLRQLGMKVAAENFHGDNYRFYSDGADWGQTGRLGMSGMSGMSARRIEQFPLALAWLSVICRVFVINSLYIDTRFA